MAILGAYEAARADDKITSVLTNLTTEQMTICAGYLDARGIPYEIRGDGCDLWAPAAVSAELKIELTQFTEGRTLSAAVNGSGAGR